MVLTHIMFIYTYKYFMLSNSLHLDKKIHKEIELLVYVTGKRISDMENIPEENIQKEIQNG